MTYCVNSCTHNRITSAIKVLPFAALILFALALPGCGSSSGSSSSGSGSGGSGGNATPPSIASIEPSKVTAGGPATITVLGANFTPSDTLELLKNGNAESGTKTEFVSSHDLHLSISSLGHYDCGDTLHTARRKRYGCFL